MSFSPVLVIVPREWADLPPLPGRLKDRPEDFCVEEVLGRTPAGHGSHVWVEVEKTGLSMDQLVRELCGALGLHPAHVGHAGLKDRHAVTRQTLSLPAWAGERLGELRLEGVRILGWRQHPGALHPGQLDGNHFTILLRGDNGHRLGEAEAWCRRLSGLGAANAFGPQRFGRDLETLRAGLAMLRGEPDTGRMGAAAPGLALSAAQGHLFNRYLALRMERGLLRRVLTGDVLQRKGKGRHFLAEDVAEAQAEFDRGHLRITGPLFGAEGLRAAADAGTLEDEVLVAEGLEEGCFRPFRRLQPGARRSLVVVPRELSVVAEAEGLRFRFFLTKGAYATELLGQLMEEPRGPGWTFPPDPIQ